MPSFLNSPFQSPILAQRGVPAFLFGKYNYLLDNTKAWISNVALTSNVATVTVQVIQGEIPKAGWLVSISNTTSTGGVFNVKRVAMTSTTIDGTGAGTIVFPLTNADVPSAAQTGTVVIEPVAVPETLAAGASIALAIPMACDYDGTQSLTAEVSFPSLPTSVTVSLQGAIVNLDANYQTLNTVGTVVGGGSHCHAGWICGQVQLLPSAHRNSNRRLQPDHRRQSIVGLRCESYFCLFWRH